MESKTRVLTFRTKLNLTKFELKPFSLLLDREEYSEDEIGNLEAPEEEDLEESPVKQFKKGQQTEDVERSPEDPLIGYEPGKQITLGLD